MAAVNLRGAEVHEVLYGACLGWTGDLSGVVVGYLPQPIGFLLETSFGRNLTLLRDSSVREPIAFDTHFVYAFTGKWPSNGTGLSPTDGYVQVYNSTVVLSFPTPLAIPMGGLSAAFQLFVVRENGSGWPEWLSKIGEELPLALTNGFPLETLKSRSPVHYDNPRTHLLGGNAWTSGWRLGVNSRGIDDELHDIARYGYPSRDCAAECPDCISAAWDNWPHPPHRIFYPNAHRR